MLLSSVLLCASIALAIVFALQLKQENDLKARQNQIIEALKEKDKNDLELSRELKLAVRDVHRMLSKMERRGLVRSYWGGLVLMTRRGLRYRFYALARSSYEFHS